MVGSGGASKGGYLLVVAHDEKERGSGVGGGSVGILALDIGRNRSSGSAHGSGVGVDDVGEIALAAFPLHKTVQLPTEGAMGDDEVSDGGCGAHRLGVKAVQHRTSGGESRRIIPIEKGG